jgi:hypothetical protein
MCTCEDRPCCGCGTEYVYQEWYDEQEDFRW